MEQQEKFLFPGAKETQNKLQIFVTSCSPDAFCMPFVFSCMTYPFWNNLCKKRYPERLPKGQEQKEKMTLESIHFDEQI